MNRLRPLLERAGRAEQAVLPVERVERPLRADRLERLRVELPRQRELAPFTATICRCSRNSERKNSARPSPRTAWRRIRRQALAPEAVEAQVERAVRPEKGPEGDPEREPRPAGS